MLSRILAVSAVAFVVSSRVAAQTPHPATGPANPGSFVVVPYVPDLAPGDPVATYCPSLVAGRPDPLGYCVKIVKDATDGLLGQNWTPLLFSNQYALPSEVWNIANLGPVFGICLDEASPPNIYVSATTTFGNYPSSWGPGGPGAVYRLDGVTKDISLVATLPNSGVGLGDVTYDRHHDQLFVSNFEDGCIYRLTTGGVTLQRFDPWGADSGAAGFAPLGERVWAVHSPRDTILGPRLLLFSAWLCDTTRKSPAWPALWPSPAPAFPGNSVFAVKVQADGSIATAQPPQLVLTTPPISTGPNGHWSSPISDIDYAMRVLAVAERTMPTGDYGTIGLGHQARVLRYRTDGTQFGPSLVVGDYVGAYGRANCAGGVALELHLSGIAYDGVWATGDALLGVAPGNYAYGVQRLPQNGNASCTPPSACTHVVDLDLDVATLDKAQAGDVAYRPRQ